MLIIYREKFAYGAGKAERRNVDAYCHDMTHEKTQNFHL
jgi:hypothetical protein